MSRTLTIFAAIILAVVALILMRGFKGTTETPPILETNQPAQTSAEPSFHEWREFTSPSGHFKVLLPSLPQRVTDKILDPTTRELRKYDTYVVADDHGAALMISAITLAPSVDAEPTEEVLKTAITDIIARNKVNKLVSIKSAPFQGRRSLDFSITSGDLLIAGKVFGNKNIIYVLSMINNSQFFNQKELLFFINSFDLMSDQTTAQPVVTDAAKKPEAFKNSEKK